jgi:hypothetical protein
MSRPLRSDHKVLFRREEAIEEIAAEWRREAGNYNSGYFNIVDFVEEVLSRKLKKRPLFISFFDTGADDEPAYVTFKPSTLHVDSEIWGLARIGDPYARYIIAHEVGHLVLHDHDAQAFSNDPNDQIIFESMNEVSAEWQANTFARYFLLPTHIVASIGSTEELVNSCGVYTNLARDRLAAVQTAKSRRYGGDACSDCGNFTLLPNGAAWKCNTCGSSWPIFSQRK